MFLPIFLFVALLFDTLNDDKNQPEKT